MRRRAGGWGPPTLAPTYTVCTRRLFRGGNVLGGCRSGRSLSRRRCAARSELPVGAAALPCTMCKASGFCTSRSIRSSASLSSLQSRRKAAPCGCGGADRRRAELSPGGRHCCARHSGPRAARVRAPGRIRTTGSHCVRVHRPRVTIVRQPTMCGSMQADPADIGLGASPERASVSSDRSAQKNVTRWVTQLQE
jgi:hypothetical protein